MPEIVSSVRCPIIFCLFSCSASLDLYHLVDLKCIIDLDVGEVLKYDTAFKAELDLLDLILESLE